MINAESIMTELEKFVYQDVVAVHGEKVALCSADAMFECLWLNFRKQSLYVPTSDRPALERRKEAIWQDFNGNNHAELSVKYRLSSQHIYSIIRKRRAKSSANIEPTEKPSPDNQNKPLTLWVIEEYLPADLVKCGLSGEEAVTLARKVAAYLCQRFPGGLIVISDKLKSSRQAAAPTAAF